MNKEAQKIPRPGRRPAASKRAGSESEKGRVLLSHHDYVDHYTEEGQRLLLAGVEPGQPPSAYLSAYPRLAEYLRKHGDALAERGVVSAEVDAGQVLIQRLLDLQAEFVSPALGEAQARTLHAAYLRLCRLRESVYRLSRGKGHEAVRARFGLDYAVEMTSASSVLHGIRLFLAGARQEPAGLGAFRLIARDIDELDACGSQLQGILPDRDLRPSPAARRALLSVEAYFTSLAVAVSNAFPEGDPRRIAGLRLIPRTRDRRKRSVPPPRQWRPPYSEE